MTADVISMQAEADAIAARRADAIRRHPSSLSRRALVERQQQLGSLLIAIGDGRLSITDDADLPLIVGTLLHCAPQSFVHPDVVAKSVQEAAAAHTTGDASDTAFIASQLAAGTAHTGTYGYLMQGCQMLCDWLTAAAVAR